MTLPIATVSTHAAAVLDELTAALNVGESRTIDCGTGFMAVHVECLRQTPHGAVFSVAHYFNANGDLVADPDLELLRRSDRSWAPLSFQDSLAHRVVARLRDDGTVEVDARGQRELVRFANHWMRNVAAQQGIRPRRTR